MSGERETTDPKMVEMYPKIHAAVIDSLGNQLFDARKQIDGLLAELGQERLLNGQLHTDRDEWKRLAWHAWCNMGMDSDCSAEDCPDCQSIADQHND